MPVLEALGRLENVWGWRRPQQLRLERKRKGGDDVIDAESLVGTCQDRSNSTAIVLEGRDRPADLQAARGTVVHHGIGNRANSTGGVEE